MTALPENVDVAVIGGGYYGCTAADQIKLERPELNVVVLERAGQLFARASSTNQGQLHAGYMYSKYPDVAHECVVGAEEFGQLYGGAINTDVLTYYAVHRNSDISLADYEAFCDGVGLPLRPVIDPSPAFFGQSLASVYETTEKTFDNNKLQDILAARLGASGVRVITSFDVAAIQPQDRGIVLQGADGRLIRARAVCNATFADANSLHERSNMPKLPLDHAVFLHFLIKLPEEYRNQGLIVVRGPYAAVSPIKERGGATHTLASGQFRVLRTASGDAPDEYVAQEEILSRYAQAAAEARSYLPGLANAALIGHVVGTRTNYIDSATGIAASKAVVLQNYGRVKNYHVVFGGKVTCVSEIVDPIRRIAQKL